MTDPVVRFSKVSKSFGSAAVLREIDFALPAGQFLGLAGAIETGKAEKLARRQREIDPAQHCRGAETLPTLGEPKDRAGH